MGPLPLAAVLVAFAPGLGPEGPALPPDDGVPRTVTVSQQPTGTLEPAPVPEPEPTVVDDEPAPIVARRMQLDERWAARERHGFAWAFDLGLNVVPLGLVDGLFGIPQGRLSFFFGGSLSTRRTMRGYRKVALGGVSEIDVALPVHRHHFGVDFQAGKHGRFFARTHAGMSFIYLSPMFGIGTRLGMTVRPRGKRTDFAFGLSSTVDVASWAVWPTIGVFFGALAY